MGKWKATEVSSSPRLILPRPVPKLQAPPIFVGGGYGSSSSSSSSAIGRSEALKVHSQAEKRRRERINAHLSTLRRMVPDATKMDKASLLGSVIDHVKDLKRKVVDAGEGLAVPKDANHVTVEEGGGGGSGGMDLEDELTSTSASNDDDDKGFDYVKASICCDDRPDLLVSLNRTFHGLGLRAVRADITCLGGRVQNEFLLQSGSGLSSSTLKKEVLREALARVASFDVAAPDHSTTTTPSSSSSSSSSSRKRQRLLQSHYTTPSSP